MEKTLQDYLSGNIENADLANTQNIQNNFLEILCWFQAFCEVTHIPPEEKSAIEVRTKEIYSTALSKLNEARSKAKQSPPAS